MQHGTCLVAPEIDVVFLSTVPVGTKLLLFRLHFHLIAFPLGPSQAFILPKLPFAILRPLERAQFLRSSQSMKTKIQYLETESLRPTFSTDGFVFCVCRRHSVYVFCHSGVFIKRK